MHLPCAFLKKAFLLLALGTTASAYAGGISASGTITDVEVSPGLYDYSLTLNNTGTTNIETFWFGWIPAPATGFLSAAPTDVVSPAGWGDKLTNGGDAIQWTTTTEPLAAGDALSGFSFESTETPAELALDFGGTGAASGDPDLTSFVYIGAPFGDPGDQFVVSQTPEPGTLLLTLTGVGLTALGLSRRRLLGSDLIRG
jgi:hypothetical protein